MTPIERPKPPCGLAAAARQEKSGSSLISPIGGWRDRQGGGLERPKPLCKLDAVAEQGKKQKACEEAKDKLTICFK
ncbi:hypothetical protein ACH0BF_14670 [Pseudobacillus sp. 179-B 2D1 NHS]|uniref:hypothetical protein n=1 Tax=Pseudobacillus sp. 179-B 2D1 NHS TaxID=3374292 RepID=UPI00387A5D01